LLTSENKIRRVVVREISGLKVDRMKSLKTLKVGFGNDEDGWSLANAVGRQLKANKIQINQSINENPKLSEPTEAF